MIDEAIGIVLDRFGGSGNIFITSDHGFGPQYGVFNLFRWLVESGFMKIRGEASLRSYLVLIRKLLSVSRKVTVFLPKHIKEKVAKAGKKFLRYKSRNYINIEASTAITLEHTIPFGAIYLLKDNQGGSVIEKLIETLNKLGLEASIWRAEDLYNGEKMENLPDIIFLIENGRVVVIQNIDGLNKPIYLDEPYSSRHTGSHRVQGIIVAYGNNVIKGRRNFDVHILDVAPTIMYLLNLPIPNYMEGKISMEIFDIKRKPKYVKPEHYHWLKLVFKTRLKLKNKFS